ncbi:MAG: hypothetical protein IKO02_08480, partial [Lentisphaeria bacterium]|nr:hypothetical protein [Lentisphaeria bacterium]
MPGSPRAERPEDDMPREPFLRRLRSTVLIFLLIAVPAGLIYAFDSYMYHYSIPMAACASSGGTVTVDRSSLVRRSPLGEYIAKSSLVKKYPWIESYLDYRHYVIPDGVTEIGESAFGGYSGIRSVT